jgi:arsenite transporter
VAQSLDGMAIYVVNGAPVVSIPIAIALFFMMYPIMVKIDFAEVVKAGKSPRPVLLTLIVNWASSRSRCSPSHVLPGLCLPGFLPGTEIVKDGTGGRAVALVHFRAILLGIAPARRWC